MLCKASSNRKSRINKSVPILEQIKAIIKNVDAKRKDECWLLLVAMAGNPEFVDEESFVEIRKALDVLKNLGISPWVLRRLENMIEDKEVARAVDFMGS